MTTSGSIAGVEAKGLWRDGMWHLELRRKMTTGDSDDAQFLIGQPVTGVLAVFDRSDDHDYIISETLTFQF